MAIRKVLKLGDPLLRKPSKAVPAEEMRSQEIKKLIRDLYETMEVEEGVGLAAPQVGILKRVIVIGTVPNSRYPNQNDKIRQQALINLEIEPATKDVEGSWEGCLSIPGMRGYIERPRKIRAKWQNENEESFDEIIEGFEAVVFQHELDHLNGILYVDRLKDSKLFGFNEELERLAEDGKEGGKGKERASASKQPQ